MQCATFLDPRFVQLSPFVPEYDRQAFLRDVEKYLKDLAEQVVPPDPEPPQAPSADPSVSSSSSAEVPAGSLQPPKASGESSSVAESPPPKKAKVDENPFFAYMSPIGKGEKSNEGGVPKVDSLRARLTKEFRSFSKTVQIPPTQDPLKWWALNATTFPILSILARRLLAIPVSSAPTERLFSRLARVNTKERSKMKPSLADALVMF